MMGAETIKAVHELMFVAIEATDMLNTVSGMLDGETGKTIADWSASLQEAIADCSRAMADELGTPQQVMRG